MNKREIIIYVSGKYSGDIDANIQKAREASIKLWELGYTVFCPHLNTFHFEKDCKCFYEDYINGDIEILRRCNAVFMLDGWKDSLGAVKEHKFALVWGIPAFYTLEELEEWHEGKPTISHKP